MTGARWLGSTAATVALLAGGPARAQDGADAHGRVPLAGDADPGDGLFVWTPDAPPTGTWSAGAIAEIDKGLLYRYVQTSETDVERQTVLDDVVGANLSVAYALTRRVQLAAGLPVFAYSKGLNGGQGPALGDMQVWAPIGLVLPGDHGFGLSVVPSIDLPTGASRRGLGDPGTGVGALLAAGYANGPLVAAANFGLERRAWGTLDALSGPNGAATLSMSVGWLVRDDLGVHLELDGEPALSPPPLRQEQAGLYTPAEGLLSVRGAQPRPGETGGLWWTAGVGHGLTRGVGTAAFRVYGGVGWTKPAKIGGSDVQAAPVVAFHVVDPDGRPVAGASIDVGRKPLGTTSADGTATVDELNWRRGVVVSADGFVPSEVAEPTTAGPIEVVLAWKPVAAAFEVKDQQGAPVAATVTATNAAGETQTGTVGADGTASIPLAPGPWTVTIAAPSLGEQVRQIDVPGGARAPAPLEAILLPQQGDGAVHLTLHDADGKPLSGARVLVDGLPVGTSGGGVLDVRGLPAGKHRIEVSAEGFTTAEARDVAVDAGKTADADIVLKRLPGSVKVVAKGPQGKVVDASVRFDGPSRLAATPLGDYGERIFVLRPGTWKVVVVSPTYGIQQREVVVPPDETDLITVEVVLQPAESGHAELVVRCVDPDGNPVDGAEIDLDGKPLGQTSTGGSVDLQDLDPGARQLAVRAAHMRDVAEGVVLVEGLQEKVLTVPWQAGTVRVTARTPDAPVADATARFLGGASMAPLPLGGDGVEYTTLPAGTWSVLVASQKYGLQQRQVVVPQDSRSLLAVDVVLNPPEGGGANLVVRVTDPGQQPIAGAAVSLDGTPLGATSSGGDLALQDLDAGTRRLEVDADPYKPKVLPSLKVAKGDQAVDVQLDWQPGAVKVVARGPNGPVTDAIVRFAGPAVLAPKPVDAHGERLFQLTPGKWQAIAISPSLGIAQQDVTIKADQKGLVEVDFDLSAVAEGEAEMLVRAQDPDGKPIVGAEIKLDSVAKGKTSAGGGLLLGGMHPGKSTIEIVGKDFLAKKVDVDVAAGSQERIVTLDWVPQPLDVVVKDQSGQPVDAAVRFEGPETRAPEQVGADGVAEFELRPGTWQVLASTAELGMQAREVTIAPGQGVQTVELVLSPAKVGLTGQQVVIKEQVPFDFNSAVLKPDSKAVLDEVAATLLGHPDIARVEIQGHTDDVGKPDYNLELSVERANAVKDALVARGVAPERLVAQGYGATRPLDPSQTDEARARNRRVQFEILETAAADANNGSAPK